MKGIIVSVLRNAEFPDSTLGGVSSKLARFVLVGNGVAEVFSPTEEMPALRLVRREIGGREYLHCEPLEKPKDCYVMFGGNYVVTSDSRFPNRYPIPIHDRFERG